MSRQEKFEFLFQLYGDMIYRYCALHTKNLQDAQDVFQEVFLKLYEKDPHFNDEQHAKAWLLKVSMNLCKSYHRFFSRHPFVEYDEKLHVTHVNEKEPDLLYALRKLPNHYRSVLYLYYYEGYASKEISEILNKKEATIRTWLARGKKQLKEILKEEELDERAIPHIREVES